MKDVWEYLKGLKTAIFSFLVMSVGLIQEIGVEKFVPEQDVGMVLLGIGLATLVLRMVTTGPMAGVNKIVIKKREKQ